MPITEKNQMWVIKIKLDLEKIFLAGFFALFLLLGSGFLFDQRIKHDFPYAYLASDAFQHQVRAQSIKDAGNYRNEASYIVFGVNDAIGYYPPVLYDLSVVLSHISGLEVYDTIYFIVFFFAGLGSLVMYMIIKQFNKNAAIISLPFSLLVFFGGLYSGFTWGHWPAILSQFFLICVIWYCARIELSGSYFLLGAFLSATFMTHTSEALFGIVFLAIFFIALTIIKRKIDFGLIKNLALGGVIFLILASYYIVIFKGVWVPRQPFSLSSSASWDNPTIYLTDFKVLLLFLLIGAVVSIFLIRKSLVPATASITMLLIGLGNYFGFREKAFQLRFSWPILLSFLMGFGIYWILKLVIRNWKQFYSFILAVLIVLAILFGVPFIPHYTVLTSNGLMDQYHWEMLNWISKNTAAESKVYFFYGDIYGQDALLRNAKRTHVAVMPQDFVDAINKKEIRRIYDTKWPGDSGGGAPYRKSFFTFGFRLDELPELSGKKDICDYDYFVFDKVSGQPVLAKYNLLLAEELQTKGANMVFENPYSIVMKNNKGADCIEKRNL